MFGLSFSRTPEAKAAASISTVSRTDAEPISPDTVRRFPHLAPYVGNVLLGSPELQIVLAGVPPVPVATVWQPVALGFYRCRDGVWSRDEALGGFDLTNVETTRGSSLQPLALDLGRDPDGSVAYVSFIYGSPASSARDLVTWRLDGSIDRLSLYFDKYTVPAGGKTASVAGYWRLRLHGAAAQIRGGEQQLGSLHGIPYLLRYKGNDTVGILGYRPFNVLATDAAGSGDAFGSEHAKGRVASHGAKGATGTGPAKTGAVAVAAATAAGLDAASQILVPALSAHRGGQVPPLDGFEFLLSQAATARMIGRVATLADCLYGVERPREALRDEAKVEWSQTCEALVALGALRLQLSPTDSAPLVPQPVFVFDGGGRLLQMAYLTGPRSLTFSLPPGSSYQLGDTAAGRTWPGVKSFDLVAGETMDFSLPPRQSGSLTVATATPGGEAAVVALENLSSGEQAPGFISRSFASDASAGDNGTALSPHIWLSAGPELRGDLLVGDYAVTVARGRSGSYCRQAISVTAGHTTLVDCSKGMARLPQPLAKDVSFADLALSSMNLPPVQLDRLRQALGVDVTARELNVSGAAKARDDDTGGQHLPVLTAVNPATAMSLRFWPATPELAKRWEQALRSAPADPVQRFARFLRDENATGWSELGCPVAGMNASDYEALVEQLQPSALRLFGCATATASEEQLALWAQLATSHPGRGGPLLLTAATWLDAPEQGLFLPRLAFEQPHASLVEPGGAWRSLQTRAYSLSAGATAFLRHLQPVAGPELARRQAKGLIPREPVSAGPAAPGAVLSAASAEAKAAPGYEPGYYDLSISITVLADAHAREVAVYTEQGRLKRAFLPQDFGSKGLVSVQSLKLSEARWLRIEVRGQSPRLVDAMGGTGNQRSRTAQATQGGEAQLLSATNFMSVAALVGAGAQAQPSAQAQEGAPVRSPDADATIGETDEPGENPSPKEPTTDKNELASPQATPGMDQARVAR